MSLTSGAMQVRVTLARFDAALRRSESSDMRDDGDVVRAYRALAHVSDDYIASRRSLEYCGEWSRIRDSIASATSADDTRTRMLRFTEASLSSENAEQFFSSKDWRLVLASLKYFLWDAV